jgi:hypothetical protein
MWNKKIHVILLILLLAGMALMPMVSATANLTNEHRVKKVSASCFIPSVEFIAYIHAPSITGQQKIEVVRIASAPGLQGALSSASGLSGTGKPFSHYLNGLHGPVTIHRAYPYSGNLYLSMTVGSPDSDEYGLAYAIVDRENSTVLEEGFTDWHKYW